LPKAFDIFRSRANEEIDSLGRPHQTMESHRRRANQHVLEPSRFERSQDTEELVSIHRLRVSRVASIDQ
jgi:hypothetical protein